ncbi:hypothetical protein GCK72_026083 [Caenorhabditis remanei]|uniref:Uncharacterized protein n=1 Tax=Caenorhabditis remanei TaxID=31234 RepID=A0A6A5G4H9_CAERE|nr:hypothetical protein GCK72_026083 [Caenorhabditis remanei]KAF1749615.1 hypothetical protein GCK72_026083 [Caenorhabditis remanei]
MDIVVTKAKYEGSIPVKLVHLLTEDYKVIDINAPVLKNDRELVNMLSRLWNVKTMKDSDDLCIRFYHFTCCMPVTLHTIMQPIMYWYDRFAP